MTPNTSETSQRDASSSEPNGAVSRYGSTGPRLITW